MFQLNTHILTSFVQSPPVSFIRSKLVLTILSFLVLLLYGKCFVYFALLVTCLEIKIIVLDM